jgi:outer membrane protein OmpA-like peptidoglycan-associated protein
MDVKITLFKLTKIPSWYRGFLFILAGFFCFALFGCASSTVSRSSATQVDNVYYNGNAMLAHSGDNDPAEAYQIAPQTTKGIVLGATAGAVAGAAATGSTGILPGIAGGAILGGVLGAYVDYHTTMRDQLENRGVKVIVLGDQVKMIWASEQIFIGMTPDITYQGYSTLDAIAKYVNLYKTQLIKIEAFTNQTGDDQVNCVVSQQQAVAIEKYLWPRVNTRVITAKGKGGHHLLEANNPNWGEGINYRVEITLEKLPA